MTLEEFYKEEVEEMEEKRKTFYRCLDCGAIFNGLELKEYDEVIGDFWGAPAFDSFMLCPYCDSENINERE